MFAQSSETSLCDVFDCVVVGLGGHGAACAANLALKGLKVLGIDRFSPVHANGSSHGKSRIFRTAYFEDPSYVPLLRRSLELWKALQRTASHHDILHMTGVSSFLFSASLLRN